MMDFKEEPQRVSDLALPEDLTEEANEGRHQPKEDKALLLL